MSSGIIRRSLSLSLPRSVVSRTVAYWASLFSIGEPVVAEELSPAFEASGWQDTTPNNVQSRVVPAFLLIMQLLPPFELPIPGRMPGRPASARVRLGLQVSLAL